MREEHSEDMINNLSEVHPSVPQHEETYSYKSRGMRDKIAKGFVTILAESADFLFRERYGHRAIVLETVASVPGMVGGFFQHMKSLRRIQDDRGWIQTLLDEAENERMHLLIYSEIAKPTAFERFLIIIVQFFFSLLYFVLYACSPKTAHRVVGYFEEQAIHSYETYLRLVHEGVHENIEATTLAKSYWNLQENARLTDVIEATIRDEMLHRDVNHRFANDREGTKLWW
jgi:ubiquinol oxidase